MSKRDAIIFVVGIFLALLAFIIVTAAIGREEIRLGDGRLVGDVGKQADQLDRDDVAVYHTGAPLPGGALCLVDDTGGFPVEQAAAAFDGLVDVTVGDCADAETVAVVRTVVRDEAWSGWWNSPTTDRDHGLISLNLAQAFRVDPAMWRMVLVHEIAHALGLEHTYEGDSIMHPLTGAATHDGLTDADRAQLTNLYGGQQ